MNLSVSRLLPPFQVAICQSDALSIILKREIAQKIITTKYNSWANTIPGVVQNKNMSKSAVQVLYVSLSILWRCSFQSKDQLLWGIMGVLLC